MSKQAWINKTRENPIRTNDDGSFKQRTMMNSTHCSLRSKGKNYVHTILCPFSPFSAFQGFFMTFDESVDLFLEGTKPSVITFREASWVECFPLQLGVGKSLKIVYEREKRKRGVMGERAWGTSGVSPGPISWPGCRLQSMFTLP